MPSSMRQRGEDSWQLRVHTGRDPITGHKAWVSHCTFLHGFDQNSLLQPASHAFGEPRIAWGGRFE